MRSAEQILPDPYETIHAQTMVPCAHLLWGSVWAGIAAGATARAQAFMRNAVRHGGGQLPPGAPQFTQALASLRTLRGMLCDLAARVRARAWTIRRRSPRSSSRSLITLTKVEASELAVADRDARACAPAGCPATAATATSASGVTCATCCPRRS